MGKKIGSVYVVSRHNKTKATTVGEFETRDSAVAAMVDHYKSAPKRGKFYYAISHEELEEIGGVVMRLFSIVLSANGEQTYWKYTPQQIDVLMGG